MLSPITWINGAGPVHSVCLLLCFIAGLAASAHTVWRLRQSQRPNSLALTAALGSTLLYAVYASTIHFTGQWQSALQSSNLIKRQTYLAMAMSEAVCAQILAGCLTSLVAGGLILACLSQLSLGERPRLNLAGAAAILTVCLTGTALLSGASTGVWEPAAFRAMAYLVAGLLTTAILLTTHIRGPGAHVGPIAALTLPLLVAGLDLFTMGLNTYSSLSAIAVAVPADKQVLLNQLLNQTQDTQIYSAIAIVLALTLAALGPIASWNRHREQAKQHVVAMGISLVVAATSLLFVSSYLAPINPGTTFAEQMRDSAGQEVSE